MGRAAGCGRGGETEACGPPPSPWGRALGSDPRWDAGKDPQTSLWGNIPSLSICMEVTPPLSTLMGKYPPPQHFFGGNIPFSAPIRRKSPLSASLWGDSTLSIIFLGEKSPPIRIFMGEYPVLATFMGEYPPPHHHFRVKSPTLSIFMEESPPPFPQNLFLGQNIPHPQYLYGRNTPGSAAFGGNTPPPQPIFMGQIPPTSPTPFGGNIPPSTFLGMRVSPIGQRWGHTHLHSPTPH